MAYEDPNFKPINACENNIEVIDNSFRDSWMLYINSSFEQLSEDEVSAIVFELQNVEPQTWSASERDFMDSFVESTKTFDRNLPPGESAWAKYLMAGIGELTGFEVAEINTMLQETEESNFVTEQYKKELQVRMQKERQDEVQERDDMYRHAA